MLKTPKITIIGSGYVGMSLGVLLGQKCEVTILEIDKVKVDKINKGVSPIKDSLIQEYLDTKEINIFATLLPNEALINADYFIIATPTNYDESTNMFDTSSVESSISEVIKYSKEALIIIKSTIPVGHTKYLREKFNTDRIIFSPEFLREGNALYDNLHPSRIIIGGDSKKIKNFAEILLSQSLNDSTVIVYMRSDEAEAVKLFSNTYLAMRVSFFNELDSFAMENNLDSYNLIKGVCLDYRIGNKYNNPSFGYGGYCLPKDTKQLLSNYKKVPQKIIQAVVESNSTRKDFIVSKILSKKPNKIGIYQLTMKAGSDNFRSSSIVSIMNRLKKHKVDLVIYEDLIDQNSFLDVKIEKDFKVFINECDLIIANRMSKELNEFSDKVFTRDLFGND
ncbi:nucleotide sugar dehydrogenase [Gammaproteobacteria bacterium]|nr:nucleotide sugar dehydrogenase [Gammaproteobacteria bacterium]